MSQCSIYFAIACITTAPLQPSPPKQHFFFWCLRVWVCFHESQIEICKQAVSSSNNWSLDSELCMLVRHDCSRLCTNTSRFGGIIGFLYILYGHGLRFSLSLLFGLNWAVNECSTLCVCIMCECGRILLSIFMILYNICAAKWACETADQWHNFVVAAAADAVVVCAPCQSIWFT